MIEINNELNDNIENLKNEILQQKQMMQEEI